MVTILSWCRPEWHSDDDAAGAIKIVMTGSASDPLEWQPHIGNRKRRDDLAERARDPDDPLKLAMVRDMWLQPGWKTTKQRKALRRFQDAVLELGKAFALTSASDYPQGGQALSVLRQPDRAE